MKVLFMIYVILGILYFKKNILELSAPITMVDGDFEAEFKFKTNALVLNDKNLINKILTIVFCPTSLLFKFLCEAFFFSLFLIKTRIELEKFNK